MANSTSTPKNKNTPIIILLVILIVAVIGVGAYLIIKDTTKDNSQNSQTAQTTQAGTKTTPNNTNTNNNAPSESTNTPTSEIEAGITYTEVRGDDYYIEAQTNDVVSGTCEISLIPSAGGNTYSDTDELDAHDKVSTCDEDFDLRKLSSGAYTVRVIINAHDGRTTTLETSVNI